MVDDVRHGGRRRETTAERADTRNALTRAAGTAERALTDFETLLRGIDDARLRRADPAVLAVGIEVPPLGRLTGTSLVPMLAGHLQGHVAQAKAILHARNALPRAAERTPAP